MAPSFSSASDHDAGHYRIDEDTQLRLVQARDHLVLLASLTQSNKHNDEPLSIAPAALAQCFSQLADALQHILDEMHWHRSE